MGRLGGVWLGEWVGGWSGGEWVGGTKIGAWSLGRQGGLARQSVGGGVESQSVPRSVGRWSSGVTSSKSSQQGKKVIIHIEHPADPHHLTTSIITTLYATRVDFSIPSRLISFLGQFLRIFRDFSPILGQKLPHFLI